MASPERPAEQSDEELLAELQRGREPAFATLVRRYEKELFSYLSRYVGDAGLAEDVFQNTFLQVFLKRSSFDPARRFKPWLYAVATHQAVDALRRQKRVTRLSLEQATADQDGEATTLLDLVPARGPDAGAAAMLAEKRLRVRAAVDQLAEHLKPVVVMAYFQGLKYQDIADSLGIPVGTVKSRLFAAVRLLEERWRKEPDL